MSVPLPIDENPFQYMLPTEKSLAIITPLREQFFLLWDHIKKNVPDSRERSLAITNLEQAAMWAVKAAVGRGS